MKGQRIRSLRGLQRLSLNKRAVWCSVYGRPIAAAFLMNMQARCVSRLLDAGVFKYTANRKKPAK